MDLKLPSGLCASCVHAQAITTSKDSTFIRCNLSFSDPRFPRYPALPVIQCDGQRGRSTSTNGPCSNHENRTNK